MTTTTDQHIPDGCLACAVRALTEGTPTTWWPGEPGASVQGIVLALGTVESPALYRTVPYADLWLGGFDRVRVAALGLHLERQFEMAAPTVGDAMTVIFQGYGEISSGKNQGRKYRRFSLNVMRGHH